MSASYLSLSEIQWTKKLQALETLHRGCVLCPRACGVDRREKPGVCGAPDGLVVSSVNTHFGEEPPITGEGGSGTVFVSHCNLKCRFCQNYPISQLGNGKAMTALELAEKLLGLQKRGAHNINFVSPAHYTFRIAEAIHLAAGMGLTLPIVWNTNAYERVEALREMDGIVDIYLPDLKYSDDLHAKRYSGAPNYWKVATEAIQEMFRQVGQLRYDEEGELATRGILVRHLVLPEGLAGTREVLRFIAEELGPETTLSLMAQYFPAHRAADDPVIGRAIMEEEYRVALDALEEFGFTEGFTQEDIFRFC